MSHRAESMFRRDEYIESPKYPAGLGYEAAGIVDAVGNDVTGLAVGDAVMAIEPNAVERLVATFEEAATG